MDGVWNRVEVQPMMFEFTYIITDNARKQQVDETNGRRRGNRQ